MTSGNSLGSSADREMTLADQRLLLFCLFKKSGVFFEGDRIVFWSNRLSYATMKEEALTGELHSYNLLSYADAPNGMLYHGKRFQQVALALSQLKDARSQLVVPRPFMEPWEKPWESPSDREYSTFVLATLLPDPSARGETEQGHTAQKLEVLRWICPCCKFDNQTSVHFGSPFITHRGITCVMCEEVAPLTTLFEQPQVGDILVAAGLDDFNPWAPPVSPEDIPF